MRKLLFAVLIFSLGSVYAGAWKDYETLRKDIISERLTPKSLETAYKLWPTDKQLHSALSSAHQLYSSNYNRNNRALMQKRHRVAYIKFIQAKPLESVLYEFLMEQETTMNLNLIGSKSKSPGLVLAWKWAYMAHAALYGYQATGDTRYLDLVINGTKRAFQYTDQAQGIKDSFGRDDVTGWSLLHKGRYGREITLPGRILSPILELQTLVDATPALQASHGHKVKPLSDRALAVIAEYLPFAIIDKQHGWHYFTYLWNDEHDALNHIAAYAKATAIAYQLTGKTKYRDFAVGFRKYFTDHAKSATNGSLVWPYQMLADPAKRNPEPFWKGAITTGGLTNMHEYGIKLNRSTQVGITFSFTKNISREFHKNFFQINSVMDPNVDFRLTGYNDFRYRGIQMSLYTNFVILDQFVPGVRDGIINTVAHRLDLFPKGFLAEPSDAESYAWMLKQDQKNK